MVAASLLVLVGKRFDRFLMASFWSFLLCCIEGCIWWRIMAILDFDERSSFAAVVST